MPAECHVRRVHIRTPDRTYAPHLAFVLEDALRTASFPGIPANGVVYVRRLDLGRHDPSVSSGVLAKRIEDIFEDLRPVAVTEIAPERPDATVVWFPDELSQYRFVMKLFAENHQPVSWYWAVAIKGWDPGLTVKKTYQLILSHMAGRESGIQGMAFVFEPLVKAGKLCDALDALERKEAVRLLITMGLKANYDVDFIPGSGRNEAVGAGRDGEAEIGSTLPLTPAYRDAVEEAVRTWSVFDPRTMLLSYLILTAMRKKATPFDANRLLAAFAGPRDTPRDAAVISAPQRNERRTSKSAANAFGQKEGGLQARHAEANDPDKENLFELPAGKSLIRGSESAESSNRLIRDDRYRDTQPHPEEGSRSHAAGDQPMKMIGATADVAPEKGQITRPPAPLSFLEEGRDALPQPYFGGFAGPLSEYAGFVFLIPLLQRLGMEMLLKTYPEYKDMRVLERTLFRSAELLRIPESDPALSFLGEKPGECIQPRNLRFTVPAHWRRVLFPSPWEPLDLRIGRVAGLPGRRLLLDGKERLVLGVWDSKNRSLVAPWLHTSRKPFRQAAPQAWSLERLVDTLVLAMRRYVRMHASMGLLALVRRPACIATTKTHLDVSIPFSRLDVRVRMAGLDIDPGWVPWLGRVVQFHYVGEER